MTADLAISTRGLRKTYRTLNLHALGRGRGARPRRAGRRRARRSSARTARARRRRSACCSASSAPTPAPCACSTRTCRTARRSVVGRVGAIVEQPKFFPNFSGRRNLTLLAGRDRRRRDARRRRPRATWGWPTARSDRYRAYSLGMKQRLADRRDAAQGPRSADLRRADQRAGPRGHPRDPRHDARRSPTAARRSWSRATSSPRSSRSPTRSRSSRAAGSSRSGHGRRPARSAAATTRCASGCPTRRGRTRAAQRRAGRCGATGRCSSSTARPTPAGSREVLAREGVFVARARPRAGGPRVGVPRAHRRAGPGDPRGCGGPRAARSARPGRWCRVTRLVRVELLASSLVSCCVAVGLVLVGPRSWRRSPSRRRPASSRRRRSCTTTEPEVLAGNARASEVDGLPRGSRRRTGDDTTGWTCDTPRRRSRTFLADEPSFAQTGPREAGQPRDPARARALADGRQLRRRRSSRRARSATG